MQTKFDSLTEENRQLRKKAHEICRIFNRDPSKGHLKKLKQLFNSFGEHLIIEQGFHCDYGSKIDFGDRVYININCTMLDGGKISIGNDVLIGPNVQIVTINHSLDIKERLKRENFASNVSVGNNVWIGAGAIILPGVTIGEGAVIAAGSVVNRSVEAFSLVAGNPAKFKKKLI